MTSRKPPSKEIHQSPLLARLARDGRQSPAYHSSKKLETGLASRVQGRRTAGSGNKFEKGDIRKYGIMRIEHKGTAKKSFRVTTEMLEKIELAARGCDELPIFVVDFLDELGNSSGREIACLPLKDLLDLIDEQASAETDSQHDEHAPAPHGADEARLRRRVTKIARIKSDKKR